MIEYLEFVKTSIHNHFGDKESEKTLNDKYDKQTKMNYTSAYARLKNAQDNNYNLLALTNANTFSIIDYITLKVMAKKMKIELIPGIEINIANAVKNSFLHTIVLIDPNSNLIEFEKNLNTCISANKDNYISIEQLVSIIIKSRVIIIPHGIKQEGASRSASANGEQLKEIIAFDEAIPVIIEDNKSFHKITLIEKLKEELNREELAWLERSANISSADRTDFSSIQSPSYIWGNSSFDDLYYASLMKGNRIKRDNDIITKSTFINKIVISEKNKEAQIKETAIYCSHGLNSIIGQSGSGKTLLLNALKQKLTGESLKNNNTGLSNYDDIYKNIEIKLYDIEDNEITLDSNWKVYEGENLYNKILQAYSNDKKEILAELNIDIDKRKFNNIISNFSKDITNYKNNLITINKINNEINSTLTSLISNIKFLEENNIQGSNIIYLKEESKTTKKIELLQSILDKRKDRKEIEVIENKLLQFDKKYEMNNAEEIDKLLSKYIDKINNKIKEQIIEELKISKTIAKENSIYEIVEKYNSLLGKKGSAILKRKQEILTLIEILKNKIKELIITKKKLAIKPLTSDIFKNSYSIKKNNYANIVIKCNSLSFSNQQLSELFDSNIGSARNKINVSTFKGINLDLCNLDSIKKFVNVFVEQEYDSDLIMSSDDSLYISYELQLKDSSGKYENIESMSAGELGKTYISNMIDSEIEKEGANIIIMFDQPENNLEKRFILNDLAKKIDELRNHYQVFITTHEPLLVVNSDSNNIIQAINNKSAVSKSNNIEYNKLSFVKESKTKNEMVEKIAELVDGSHDAVKERDRIYGGMLNENRS